MKSCEECYHYEACKEMYEAVLSQDWYPFAICPSFKDRSRIVELPCKLGDKAFWPCPAVNKILPFTVESFIIQDGELFVMGAHGEGEFPWKECRMTREEAEAALAKMKV